MGNVDCRLPNAEWLVTASRTFGVRELAPAFRLPSIKAAASRRTPKLHLLPVNSCDSRSRPFARSLSCQPHNRRPQRRSLVEDGLAVGAPVAFVRVACGDQLLHGGTSGESTGPGRGRGNHVYRRFHDRAGCRCRTREVGFG